MTASAAIQRLAERGLLDLAYEVARRYDATVPEMLTRSRDPGLCAARQALFAALHDRGHWSSNRIGTLLGFDHSTVRHGLQKHRERSAAEVPVTERDRSSRECVRDGKSDHSQPVPTSPYASEMM